MDQNQNTKLTETIRSHWAQIEPQIIQKYSGVESADLEGFTDYSDLLQRVSTKVGQPTDSLDSEFRQLVDSAVS